MASSRRPVPGTRQSTRDLIGSLRQQAGLPPPDAFLSPPEDQETKTVVLPEPPQEANAVSNAGTSFRNAVPVVQTPQMPGSAAANTSRLAVSGAEPVSGRVGSSVPTMPDGRPQEGQIKLLQPEASGISGSSVQVKLVSHMLGRSVCLLLVTHYSPLVHTGHLPGNRLL